MQSSDVDRTSAQASCKPYPKLRHIAIAELQLDHRHTGSKVEGTTCYKAARHIAIQVLLRDDKNASHAIKVSLYNLVPSSAKMKEVRQLLPDGTKLAILEPYYKTFADGSSGIRVDNPADVVFLTDTVKPSQSIADADFDGTKAQGTLAFRSVNANDNKATHFSLQQRLLCLSARDTLLQNHVLKPPAGGQVQVV